MSFWSPRVATGAMFLVSGAVIGTWAANVPYVRDRLDISTTTIGLCLLAMAAGSLLAMPLTGRELSRRPSAQLTRLGALLVPLAGIVPLLAPSVAGLAGALFLLGIAVGIVDVSMNAHGVAVERETGRPVMSSLHAAWSFGGLGAAGGVALGHLVGADPRVAAAVVLALLLVVGLLAGPHLGGMSVASDAASPEGPRFARPSRGVLLIGVMVFALFMAEGAVTDWSALYLDRDLDAGAGIAALGYGAFAGGMALSRAFGDRLNRVVGARRLLVGGSALAAVSLGLMVVLGVAALALPLLLLAGIGAGNGVPLLFSAAGRIRDMPPGPAIAAASTMGYLGLLAGPPLLGFVADATSLPAALGITAVLTGGVAALGTRRG